MLTALYMVMKQIKEDFILENDLEVQNIPGTVTFEAVRGEITARSCIDVTLTRSLTNELKNWRVSNKYNASDHKTILFEMQLDELNKVEKFRNYKQADWELFKKVLDKGKLYEPVNITKKKLDMMVDRMYVILYKALNKACPERKRKFKKRTVVWYSSRLRTLRRKVRKAYHGYVNVTSANAVEKYRQLHDKYKKLCKSSRRTAWKKFKESIQTEKEMSDLAKLVQRYERNELNSLERNDGTMTTPGEERLDVLIKTHFKKATKIKRVIYDLERRIDLAQVKNKFKDWINNNKIKLAMAGLKQRSRQALTRSDR